YKQQYLEYIEYQEIQKAFTFLNKRLKPLEHLQTTPNEFKDLCYLLTAKSVHDAPSFKNWEGIGPAREKLVEQFRDILNFDNMDKDAETFNDFSPRKVSNTCRPIDFLRCFNKLLNTKSNVLDTIHVLLHDYSSFIIPNALRSTFVGHKGNAKCVEFIGEEGREIVSGSSDNTLRVWDIESAKEKGILTGHESRIWDVSSNKSGSMISSASGDGTIKLWDMKTSACVSSLTGHSGDVYTVKFHPGDA
ncbi:267_t:CDS:2, partial [Cetraspora pellucida]